MAARGLSRGALVMQCLFLAAVLLSSVAGALYLRAAVTAPARFQVRAVSVDSVPVRVTVREVADILHVFEEDIQSFISGRPDNSGCLIWPPEGCALEDMLELSEMTGVCVNTLLGRAPTGCAGCKWAAEPVEQI